MDAKEKEKKIKAETAALKRLFSKLDRTSEKKKLAYRLCEKAAFLKVSIDECQEDINENGYYEKFQQSKNLEPYDRTRPVVQTIVSFTTSYQKYIKELNDMLPKETPVQATDNFDSFVLDRLD